MEKIIKQGNCTAIGFATENDALKYVLTDDGTLTISGQGVLEGGEFDMGDSMFDDPLDVPYKLFSQFRGMDIERVVIEEGVTCLHEFCLRGLPMTEVVLPGTVTHIGHAAFLDCTRLKTVVMPSTMQRIEEDAFDGCESLSDETLAFIGKYRDIPAEIDGFYYVLRPQLREAVLVEREYPTPFMRQQSKYYTGDLVVPATVMHGGIEYTVIGISNVFLREITSITLPSTISFIDDVGISASMSLDPPIVRIADVAAWCRVKLYEAECGYASSTVARNRRLHLGDSPEPVTELVIPEGVTEIAHAVFNSCKDVRKVVLPQGLKKIGCYTFEGCSNLECIDIPEGVTEIGSGAFEGCTSLKHISLPASLTTIGHRAFRKCESLASIVIPDSVTEIAWWAFQGCSSLTSIVIPDSVTEINYDAFRGCSSLASIVIPDSVTHIGHNTFDGCSSLASIDIPASMDWIGEFAFQGCSSLTSIDIPASVTGIGRGIFEGCSSLTSIKVAGGNECFDSRNDCNGIVETSTNTLICGCKNTIIPDDVTTIGQSAFRDCEGLTSIDIPASVTEIDNHAFAECPGLTSVVIPDSVTKIDYSAFWECDNLKEISVKDKALLEKNELPASVKIIERG